MNAVAQPQTLRSRALQWLRQPTTLQGFACLFAAATGAYTGMSKEIYGPLAAASIPLLFPENSRLQQIGSILAGAAVAEAGRHALTEPTEPKPSVPPPVGS